MNGPEHYREAEGLINTARTAASLLEPEGLALVLAEAQVHATLALVAATALRGETPYSDSFGTYHSWQTVAGFESAAQPETEAAPVVASVFKAAWAGTPLGTYTNLSAAQTHCTADATNNAENPDAIAFEWSGDAHEPGDPCELLLTVNGVQDTTDYTVTRVEVDTEYDPEADA